MPYIDGKKVTNAEWRRQKGGTVGWKEAFGYNDGQDPAPEAAPAPEPEKPKRTRRTSTKQAAAEAAVAAITGLDIDLGGDDEDSTTDAGNEE